MDINTKINIISGIILPIIGMFGATIGFLIGIYKERNNIDWKENRDALKCAYSCCEELKRSILNLMLGESLKADIFLRTLMIMSYS
jgi:hypothetical protein